VSFLQRPYFSCLTIKLLGSKQLDLHPIWRDRGCIDDHKRGRRARR